MAKPAHITDKVVYRSLDLKAGQAPDIDVEARTATLTFASDFPVERWDWIEVLDMAGMSTERLGSGRAALLVEHERTDQIGVIQSIALADGVWRATVKFSRSVRGQEFFQDVIDGIRTLVSVGYSIDEVVLDGEADGVRTYRVSRWTPHEISIVSIPADPTVGVGRSLPDAPAQPAPTISPDTLPVQVRSHQTNKETQMDTQDPVIAERARTNDIIALGAKHKADTMARDFIASGKSVAEFREALLERAPKPDVIRSAKIDMTDKEAGQYSFLRAMEASRSGNWKEAGLERAASDAAAKSLGKQARGFVVPSDVLTARASQHKVSVNADGGYLVGTELRTQNFIEALQNRAVLNTLGATVLTDVVGSISIPKEVGLMGVTWVGEDGVAVNTKAQFGQVAMNPKTVLAKTSISRRLMLQSALSVENFVRQRFQRSLALAIDHAGIVGGTTEQEPDGVYARLTAAQKYTPTANAYADVVELETMVAVENADIGSLHYLGNAKTRGKLKVAPVFAGSDRAVWSDTNTPGVGMVNGYNAYATNHIAGDAPLVFGNWASVFIALWSGLDIVVDGITADDGSNIVKVYQDCDIAVAHLESFAAFDEA